LYCGFVYRVRSCFATVRAYVFGTPSAPLSDLCPTTVLVFMASDTAHLVCVKILLFYFTDPRARLEGDLRQDHWPLCLFKGASPTTWCHHSVHSSSLSFFFSLEQASPQAFLATTTHLGWQESRLVGTA
jgi:hypothetical protein